MDQTNGFVEPIVIVALPRLIELVGRDRLLGSMVRLRPPHRQHQQDPSSTWIELVSACIGGRPYLICIDTEPSTTTLVDRTVASQHHLSDNDTDRSRGAAEATLAQCNCEHKPPHLDKDQPNRHNHPALCSLQIVCRLQKDLATINQLALHFVLILHRTTANALTPGPLCSHVPSSTFSTYPIASHLTLFQHSVHADRVATR